MPFVRKCVIAGEITRWLVRIPLDIIISVSCAKLWKEAHVLKRSYLLAPFVRILVSGTGLGMVYPAGIRPDLLSGVVAFLLSTIFNRSIRSVS